MQPACFTRRRFPPDVSRLDDRLDFRFTLSFRDVEEMLAQRDIEASHETIRCWALKFGRYACSTTIERRPRTWSVGAGSANISDSGLKVQRKGVSRLTLPSTTTSTFQTHPIRRSTPRFFRAEADRTWATAITAA